MGRDHSYEHCGCDVFVEIMDTKIKHLIAELDEIRKHYVCVLDERNKIADENKRLRAEQASSMQTIDDLCAERATLRAEVERLRALVQEMYDCADEWLWDGQRASSHYRSALSDRIKARKPGEGG